MQSTATIESYRLESSWASMTVCGISGLAAAATVGSGVAVLGPSRVMKNPLPR